MKPNLLFLHGALGSKSQFEKLSKSLVEHYKVHTMNFSGHGGKEFPHEFSMSQFAQDVLAYIDEKNIPSTNIFGYSMGGYVALKLATTHPDRVDRIVTLGTKFDWNAESTAKEVSKLNPEIIELKVPHFAQKLKEEHAPQDWKKVMTMTADLMKGLSEGNGLTKSELTGINHQVFITRGSEDKMVTSKESAEISQLLKHGSYLEVEGLPHVFKDEHHEDIIALLDAVI